jgi:hypothetical protein
MKFFLTIAFLIVVKTVSASSILVPMDERQANHLKAYGVSFWVLENGVVME